MTISLDFLKIKPLINDKTLILTPNLRTKNAIISGYLSEHSDQVVSGSLNILSFSQWQEQLWFELSFFKPLPKILSNLAIKTWLEKTIKNEDEWTLTNPSGVANKVLEAYKNLTLWCESIDSLEANRELMNEPMTEISAEVSFFIKWITDLEFFLKNENLISSFLLTSHLLNEFELLKEFLPKHILLIGFNELMPVEKRFLEECQKMQVSIKHYDVNCQSGSAFQLSFANFKEELNFAAYYAKEYRQSGQSLAIVVNQLANYLPEVHQIFSHVFQPQEAKPWVSLDKPEYNVSAGFSLADSPLIKTAFLVLNFNAYKIKLEELHFLKNTPFIEWGETKNSIQYFLHQLCLNSRKHYSVSFILSELDKSEYTHELLRLKQCLLLLTESSGNKRSIKYYANEWKNRLQFWQWGFSLNETEKQVKKILLEAIDESVELMLLAETNSSVEALDYLTQIIKQKTFQVASDRSEVHILGLLEASGLEFDHCLLIGFNNANWPQKNKINPFLPLEFQRENNMPGSSADREYEYASDLSKTLLSSAKKLIVTSNFSEGNEINFKHSSAPFFSHLDWKEVQTDFSFIFKQLQNDSDKNTQIKADYQWVEDASINLSNTVIKGGAYLLSDYAKCPFKSMTNFQLKLKNFEMPEIGLEPKIRGSWLHDAMEVIWKTLDSQKALLAMPESELETLVHQSLLSMLKKHQAYLLAVTNETIINIELNKLKALILEWLQIDKERESFKIKSLEENVTLELNQLNLNFRIDRIDSNDKNQYEIIDYKTGKTELKNWFGVRPTEAQMPAYVLAMKTRNYLNVDVASLSYARLKTGEVAQLGIDFLAEKESTGNSLKVERTIDSLIKTDLNRAKIKQVSVIQYEQLKAQWQRSLERIAEGITSGYMPVSPKDKKQSCQFCHYQSFCRIEEKQENE